jgi:Flp pilus assembly protein TadG
MKRDGERGTIAVLSGILLTTIMGFAAFGLDLAYVRLARLEMKNATDAAADAAISRLRSMNASKTIDLSAITKLAQDIAKLNTVLGQPVILDDTDVHFGTWDYTTQTFADGDTPTMAVKITGRKSAANAAAGTVNTTFGRALGYASANIAQTSTAAYRIRSTMFQMDVTGSLAYSCSIDNSIAANLTFLDDMYLAGVAKDRLGSDVFTGAVTNIAPLQNLNANYSTMRSQWVGDGISPYSKTHALGLGLCSEVGNSTTGNFNGCGQAGPFGWPNQALITSTVAPPKCWDGDFNYNTGSLPVDVAPAVYGGTNIGAAIASGIAALSGENAYVAKAIVVFTDGGPTCCEVRGGGNWCPGPNPCCADGTLPLCVDNPGKGNACQCAQDVMNYGIAQAAAAKAANIDLYVVVLGNTARWINYAKLLVTTAGGRGMEIDTNDPTLLATELATVANSIPLALIQ